MFKCHVCGSSKANHQLLTEVFKIRDRFYLVENIPALVCQNCGKEIFSRETTEKSLEPPQKRQLAGSMKGTFKLPLPDNFDDSIEDFKEHM